MKYLFALIIPLCIIYPAIAQKSIGIDVEELAKPTATLPVKSYDAILSRLITSAHGDPNSIVAQSKFSGGLVELGYHPFFQGMYAAYADHRPFTLSPDMVWLLISQGFAAHVNNNTESLRSLFVNFNGKATLSVLDNDISLTDPNSPWEKVFPEFAKQINDYVGPQFAGILTANFTTTTPVSKVASQITMMNAVKSYFDFVIITIGCGIPRVTLEGTPEDWQKVLDKTEALRKYKLDWWIDGMEPVLKKIISASQGEKDKAFWQAMFKYHSAKGCGSPSIVDGWIVKFFPYDKLGKRNNLDSLSLHANLPDEIVKVDLEFLDGDGAGSFKKTPLELWAGFTGLRQNDKDFMLKPEIGWMIRKKDIMADNTARNQLRRQAANTDIFGGIMIRTKTMPGELLEIGPIHNLRIDFIDDVQIPDEVSTVQIDRFTITGKIDQNGIDRLKKLMPHTELIVNNVSVNAAKPTGNSLGPVN